MAKEYMERIEALRKQYLATRVEMDVYNAKYVTEGFRENAGRRTVMKYKSLAVHRQKLKCRRLPFTGGTKLITASRADNDCFPACIRLSVRIIFQKAG